MSRRDLSSLVPHLSRIEAILWQEASYHGAKRFTELFSLAKSDDAWDLGEFERQITMDKDLWHGMGTIGDQYFNDRQTNREFRMAYLRLAEACERVGLGSPFTRQVIDVLGTLAKEGLL